MTAMAPVENVVAPAIQRSGRDTLFLFHAMATSCELRIETDDTALSERVAVAVEAETRRIEQKFSRYRPDSIISKINAAAGSAISVDTETAMLLDFAAQCYALSDGLFDITSGVLRHIWRFDGSDRIPDKAEVAAILPLIGWRKAIWQRPFLTLQAGMEIDFGGLAKEYAVDRALAVAAQITKLPALVNFGGDLCVSGPRSDGTRWKVAIESVERAGAMEGMLELSQGALATSGDARRFLLKDGVRYGHILSPKNGWPIENALRSVTVAAATCVEAGMTATMAILQGKHAERFLKREAVQAWCVR
ncbi:MAG: FAD:protein FMN transferase [Rhizomicrobium sp.]|nr:FAD:protein FMN transferase [Rhizomicrobium sp.]